MIMQVFTFILMLAAFGFMCWGVVSLTIAIVKKVKAKKSASVAADTESAEKGES